MKYYAVKVGKTPGIYHTYEECLEQVKGYKGAIYKSFSTLEDALNFLNDKEEELLDIPTCYIDGSYNKETEEYSFGGVLILDKKEYYFKKKYDADEFSIYRNVAGEIKGAGFIINYCLNHDIKELMLCYDYIGIEKWYKGEWKANSKIAILYTEFTKLAKDKINITFKKIKSHTNNKYNELADKLAKEALGI